MPVCPHFGFCGGCSRQDMSYPEQLAAKEKTVRGHLEKLAVQMFHSIRSSPEIIYYRNKMEFSFGNEKDLEILGRPIDGKRTHLGLHPKGRFALVTSTPDCRLLSEESQKICADVAGWANDHDVPVFVRKTAKGDLRHLVIREGKNTGARMVNLVSKSTTPHVDELADRLQQAGHPITTFLWTAYDGLSDVAKGDSSKVYWGDGRIDEKIGDLVFKVNPASFMQTNTRAAEMMIGVLREWMEQGGGTLIDLYCGSGAIGLSLSKIFDEVIGIEINKSAVEDARHNAELNGIANAKFMEGKAEELAVSLPVNQNGSRTTVVVDPPRAGLHPKVMETLLAWAVPSIFYVSCNPESLARDLRALSAGYDILAAQPMDFFPHTDHIETAVHLSLRGASLSDAAIS